VAIDNKSVRLLDLIDIPDPAASARPLAALGEKT
jgi:hypothetical protein